MTSNEVSTTPTSLISTCDRVCPICLDPLDGIQQATECNHTFHVRCLQRWIETNAKFGFICPSCRHFCGAGSDCLDTFTDESGEVEHYPNFIVQEISGDELFSDYYTDEEGEEEQDMFFEDTFSATILESLVPSDNYVFLAAKTGYFLVKTPDGDVMKIAQRIFDSWVHLSRVELWAMMQSFGLTGRQSLETADCWGLRMFCFEVAFAINAELEEEGSAEIPCCLLLKYDLIHHPLYVDLARSFSVLWLRNIGTHSRIPLFPKTVQSIEALCRQYFIRPAAEINENNLSDVKDLMVTIYPGLFIH